MSDPIAVSILAKLTSWWGFDGDLSDSHGPNTLDTDIVVSGYSAGKQGQKINIGSRAYVTLADPVAVGLTSGKFAIGAWMTFAGGAVSSYLLGLCFDHSTAHAEAWYLGVDATGHLQCSGWDASSGTDQNIVADPDIRKTSYPITVTADDSLGRTATSEQIIRITESGPNPPGTYFVQAEWDEGVMNLFIDTALVVTAVATGAVRDPTIPFYQLGIVGAVIGLTVADMELAYLVDADVMTQAENVWLYNGGLGRSYQQIVDLAA